MIRRVVSFFRFEIILLILVTALFFLGSELNAAEVLQVKSSNTILIGDQNRNYLVRLACIEIDLENQDNAKKWLKSNLPRGTKVNLRPLGSEDGVLISNVIRLDNSMGISKALVNLKFAFDICS